MAPIHWMRAHTAYEVFGDWPWLVVSGGMIYAAFRRGLLLLGAGKNTIRFSPPLVLTNEQAETAVRIFDEALTEVEAR